MASVTASNFAALLPRASLKASTRAQSLPPLGPPVVAANGGVACRAEKMKTGPAREGSMLASLMAVAAAASVSAGPAVALVDERMTTEGTGLPFGLSNNLLGWILLGVFGLIWALYSVYTTSLDDDEESGLSL